MFAWLIRAANMKFSLAIVLLSVLACTAVGKHEDASDEFIHSEVPSKAPAAAIQYIECMEKGHCVDPSGVTENEYAEVMHQVPIEENYPEHSKQEADSHEKPSYFQLCEKFYFKMEELESKHPELKTIKHELLKKLHTYSSQFDSNLKDDEFIFPKLMDFVIHVAEELKIHFTKILKEKQIHINPLLYDPLPVEEIIAEEDYAPFIGSVRGIPGEHYPNYSEIPVTSFTCSDKEYIPGFYADLETGCQVFHVCYEHRRESFLCPLGTIFNQPILACDYWYSSNCSQAPHYYYVNEITKTNIVSKENEEIEELITSVIKGDELDSKKMLAKDEMKNLLKFLPVKAKVEDFPEVHKPIISMPLKDFGTTADKIFDGLVTTGSKVVAKGREVLKIIPEPEHKTFITPKAKVASAVKIPLIKSKFLALPIAKTKFGAGTIPVIKAKKFAKALPWTKMAALKPKLVVPALKFKSIGAGVPLVKTKLAKAAMISPLTKKALAVGYMKLLKAKKLALMG
ncbi:chitin-binding type-2 domain-containing protein [Nephila pilipes]|uniref:Chitin-binding type-2 domain-containing protein n=1 Tax=Nephila pilipes TaxID=299642 RepID=A0A8X6MZC8_NEPPI|nr:chitin-binding type-2 domain-containing protein [Nephila pilipes]